MALTGQQVSDAIDPILTAVAAMQTAVTATRTSLLDSTLPHGSVPAHHVEIMHDDVAEAIVVAAALGTDIVADLEQIQTDALS